MYRLYPTVTRACKGANVWCVAGSLVPPGEPRGGLFSDHVRRVFRLQDRPAQMTTVAGAKERQAEMPQASWSAKRERQYDHIKEGLEERGRPERTAKQIAARTVNKERARSGESRTASRASTNDISSGRRGGLRSHRGAGGRTYAQLYQEARHHGIKGRSSMNKAQLEQALGPR